VASTRSDHPVARGTLKQSKMVSPKSSLIRDDQAAPRQDSGARIWRATVRFQCEAAAEVCDGLPRKDGSLTPYAWWSASCKISSGYATNFQHYLENNVTVQGDPARVAAEVNQVNATLNRPPVAHDYVPPPEPTAPIPNRQEISVRVDLTRLSSAERLAQIPEQPDDDYGSLSFRVPADPKRMAKCILDEVGHQQASEVRDALTALLAPPQPKTPQ